MITRIVKLHFNKKYGERFVEVFDNKKDFILRQQGCSKINLLIDRSHPNIFFTISEWSSIRDLNRYRNTAEFKDTWKEIKKYFKKNAKAWSTTQHVLQNH